MSATYKGRRAVRDLVEVTLSDDERAALVESRRARGLAVEDLREGATGREILARGLAVLGALAVEVENRANDYCARSYPNLDPATVSARALDKAARYVARADTRRAVEVRALARHYAHHRGEDIEVEGEGKARTFTRTKARCDRCALAVRRARGLGILKARAVIDKGIGTGRGSMPYREGFKLQAASPNYSTWVGPEGETLSSWSSDHVSPVTGSAAPGSPERDAFRPRGWLATLADRRGLGAVLADLMREVDSSQGSRAGAINWSALARSYGVSRKALARAVREVMADLETIPVDTVGGQIVTAPREPITRARVEGDQGEGKGYDTVEVERVPIPARVEGRGDYSAHPVTATLDNAMTPTARAGIDAMVTLYPCRDGHNVEDGCPVDCPARVARAARVEALARVEGRAQYDQIVANLNPAS